MVEALAERIHVRVNEPSPEKASKALTEKLTQLWQQTRSSKTPQECFILFEYGTQKVLLKMELPFIKFFHDDFLFDRAATATVKDAIKNFLYDNNIQDAYFVDVSGGMKKAAANASGFFGGGKMSIAPLERPEVSSEDVQRVQDDFEITFDKDDVNGNH